MTPFPPQDDDEAMPGKPPMQQGGATPMQRGVTPPQGGAMPSAAPRPPMQQGAAPAPQGPQPGQAGPQGGASPEGDENVARVLWERANQLGPQDIQALGRVMNREAGLILLKLVPELSPIILEMGQMQGPEMQEIRGQFKHDDFMGSMRSKQPQPQQPAAGPPKQPNGGLRSI